MKDAQLAPSEQSLTKECGWKDGDRGGPAQTKKTSDKKRIRKRKNRLDTYRPSHGRTWEIGTRIQFQGCFCGETFELMSRKSWPTSSRPYAIIRAPNTKRNDIAPRRN